MKLAEALILRADCQKRLDQLKSRLARGVKVQEGDQPPEDPEALRAEAERTADELIRLIRRINRTNAATPFAGGGTLSDALAGRDVLAKRRALYNDTAAAAVVAQDRYSKSEVRFRSTIDIALWQKTADDLARDYRELDARIQETNWQVELIED